MLSTKTARSHSLAMMIRIPWILYTHKTIARVVWLRKERSITATPPATGILGIRGQSDSRDVYYVSNSKDLNAPLHSFISSKSSAIAEGREVTHAPLRKAGLWQDVSWSFVKSRGYASTNIAQRTRSYVNNIKGEAQYRCRYHDG